MFGRVLNTTLGAVPPDITRVCDSLSRFSDPQIYNAEQMEFSIKDFFSKCDQIHRKLRNLVRFTKEMLNERLRFLCSVKLKYYRVNYCFFGDRRNLLFLLKVDLKISRKFTKKDPRQSVIFVK